MMHEPYSENDAVLRLTIFGGEARVALLRTTQTAQRAGDIHNASDVAIAAMSRMMTGTAMLGVMMKEDKALVTIQIRGDGPAGGLTVTADSHFHAKGYVNNPHVQIPLKPNGKLDVSGAIGKGTLTVIRDIGLKEPYVGTIQMPSAEIAEDLTLYFAESEQIPSSVGLGVLVDRDWSVRQAGGFILQLMPGAGDEVIDRLEKKIAGLRSVTDLLEQGMLPEDILGELIGDFGLQITQKHEVSFACSCSRERIEKALISIGPEDVTEMIEEGKPIEVGCQFCGKQYRFGVEDLRRILSFQKKK